MTEADVIWMAKEAGLLSHIPFSNDSRVDVALCRFAALVRAQALEDAAKVCETHPDGLNMLGGDFVTCAAAIRGMR